MQEFQLGFAILSGLAGIAGTLVGAGITYGVAKAKANSDHLLLIWLERKVEAFDRYARYQLQKEGLKLEEINAILGENGKDK